MKKVYLEEFLNKLFDMLETSKTDEHYESCINYIDLYQTSLKETITNEMFRKSTMDYLNDLKTNVRNNIHNEV